MYDPNLPNGTVVFDDFSSFYDALKEAFNYSSDIESFPSKISVCLPPIEYQYTERSEKNWNQKDKLLKYLQKELSYESAIEFHLSDGTFLFLESDGQNIIVFDPQRHLFNNLIDVSNYIEDNFKFKDKIDSVIIYNRSIPELPESILEQILKVSISEGLQNQVDFLTKRGVTLSKSQTDSTLTLAIEKGDLETVNGFLKYDKSLTRQTFETGSFKGFTLLTLAIIMDRLEIVNTLLEYDKSLVTKTISEGSYMGYTPLALAISFKSPEIVNALLEHDEDKTLSKYIISENEHIMGDTALTLAIKEGSLEIVEALLEHDNSLATQVITAGLYKGDTPLTMAKKLGHLEIENALNLAIKLGNLKIENISSNYDKPVKKKPVYTHEFKTPLEIKRTKPLASHYDTEKHKSKHLTSDDDSKKQRDHSTQSRGKRKKDL